LGIRLLEWDTLLLGKYIMVFFIFLFLISTLNSGNLSNAQMVNQAYSSQWIRFYITDGRSTVLFAFHFYVYSNDTTEVDGYAQMPVQYNTTHLFLLPDLSFASLIKNNPVYESYLFSNGTRLTNRNLPINSGAPNSFYIYRLEHSFPFISIDKYGLFAVAINSTDQGDIFTEDSFWFSASGIDLVYDHLFNTSLPNLGISMNVTYIHTSSGWNISTDVMINGASYTVVKGDGVVNYYINPRGETITLYPKGLFLTYVLVLSGAVGVAVFILSVKKVRPTDASRSAQS